MNLSKKSAFAKEDELQTEEEKLVERFGDDYRRYVAGTGRFFPRRRSAPPPAE